MITYRTPGAWGPGKGSNLTPTEVDGNFYDHEQRIGAMEGSPPSAISIASFSVVGSQLFITLTDSSIQGPFAIPTSQWKFRGAWAPFIGYAANDIVTDNGSLYLVLLGHVSAATFDPGANDGSGHDFYQLLVSEPDNVLPTGGTTGQVLTKRSDDDFDTEWADETEPPRIGLLQCRVPDADLLAGKTQHLCAPFAGHFQGMDVTVQSDLEIGGTLSVEVNGFSTGLDLTISAAAVAGTIFQVELSPIFNFLKGASINIVLSPFVLSPPSSPPTGELNITLRIIEN